MKGIFNKRYEAAITPGEQKAWDAWKAWSAKNPEGTQSQFLRDTDTNGSQLYLARKKLGDKFANTGGLKAKKRVPYGTSPAASERKAKKPKMQTLIVPEAPPQQNTIVMLIPQGQLASTLAQLTGGY